LAEPIDYIEQPADVIAQAARLIEADARFALITSVDIQGGSARELGSLALVEETGRMVGYLSNGCIDRDIQFQAQEALHAGTKRLMHYGAGSPYLDLKLPCGGSLKALIDPAPDCAALIAAHTASQARSPADLTVILPAADGAAPRTFTYAPKFQLILAGRGAVFRATAKAAHAAGFEIGALSPDPEDLEAVAPFVTAQSHSLSSPEHAPAMEYLDAHSAFLTLFHDHDWEPALLEQALRTNATFIGSLGSTNAMSLRLMLLRERGLSEAQLARLHGPIGMIPSLRDAQLIAISAIAEVVTHMPRIIHRNQRAA
jgi:xanthine dehydrogenase accessory factor